jgi:hypothetical protein
MGRAYLRRRACAATWLIAATLTLDARIAHGEDAHLRMPEAPAALAYSDDATPKPAAQGLKLDLEPRKSYLIPAMEIVGFEAGLNLFDRTFLGSDYDSNLSTIHRHLRGGWVVDNDPYAINQLGHPYQGSVYQGLARSAGLTYWESLGYTFAGSGLWEIAGENTPPSRNDQVASGIAGSFLGEALFRMAHLVLEEGGGSRLQRELTAAAISPSLGFNRMVYGKRFDGLFESHHPAYYSRLQIGVSGTAQNMPGTSTKLKRTEGLVDYTMNYGLPGKDGYTYRRPFDYFSFQAIGSTANAVESLTTHGLLIGTSYDGGKYYRGIWGLYGSYDYIAPQVFRVSSTALSLGTTGQAWLTRSVALQGTALLGAGYAAVGTINGTQDNDYHYGVAPQALLALRLIFGNQAALDMSAREYFVSRVGADDRGRGGHDNIARADLSFTWRIHKRHAVSIKYLWTRRDAAYPDLGDRTQQRGTLGIFYTLIGQDGFGAVDWR